MIYPKIDINLHLFLTFNLTLVARFQSETVILVWSYLNWLDLPLEENVKICQFVKSPFGSIVSLGKLVPLRHVKIFKTVSSSELFRSVKTVSDQNRPWIQTDVKMLSDRVQSCSDFNNLDTKRVKLSHYLSGVAPLSRIK